MDPDCSGMFDCISILKKIYFGRPTTPNSCISKIRSKILRVFGTVPECVGTVPEVCWDCSKSVLGLFQKCVGTVTKVCFCVFLCVFVCLEQSQKSESDHVEKMPIELVVIPKKFSFS